MTSLLMGWNGSLSTCSSRSPDPSVLGASEVVAQPMEVCDAPPNSKCTLCLLH
jgi:hypothetical protein